MTSRVLFISSIPTHPCDAGNRARILALFRSVRSLGHEVHFAYLQTWPWETVDLDAMRAELGADHLYVISAQAPSFKGAKMALSRRIMRRLGLKCGYDYPLDGWYDPATTAILAELQARIGFNVVIVEYVFSSGAFAAFGEQCFKILDTHDIFADRSAKRTGNGKRLSWYSTSLAEENKGLLRADLILAIQEIEAATFRARLGGDSTTVTTVSHIIPNINPVDPPYTHAASFFSARNEANQAALHYFKKSVLPFILERMPNFKLYIGGSICDILQPSPGIELIGRVNDAKEILDKAPIAVNPVQIGTGINIKLLDALGVGIPSVTTKSGVRGVPASFQAGIRVVSDSDAKSFAGAVIELLTDRQSWEVACKAANAAALDWNDCQLVQLATAIVKLPNKNLSKNNYRLSLNSSS